MKGVRGNGEITAKEMRKSENYWIRITQGQQFLEEFTSLKKQGQVEAIVIKRNEYCV